MPTPPSRASAVPVGVILPSAFKVVWGQFYDYVFALLGNDGTPAKAREALNIQLPNYLDNADGAIYQRAVAATADDFYMDDRWYALTQTGTITPSQISNPEDGYRFGLRLTQSQAVAQRMGRAQIVPGDRTSELRGRTVTFGGRLRLSTAATVRVALLAWTGAEDAVVSDVVANWASAVYTPANFFAAATLTVIGTSAAVMAAATPANVSVSGAVPAGATNLIAFYWTDAAAAQNVTLDAWAMRLVDASTLVDYQRLPRAQDLHNCQSWVELYSGPVFTFAKARESDRTRVATVPFKARKRGVPVVTLLVSSPDGGGAITATPGVDGVSFQSLATLDAQAPTVTSFIAAADL